MTATSNDTTSNEYNYIVADVKIINNDNVYTIYGTIYKIPATATVANTTMTATATVADDNNESDV